MINLTVLMKKKDKLGELGEEMATKFLLEKGYVIRDRNWRYDKKEIDIIAQKDNLLVVVEVKTRKYDFIEKPEETVSKQKERFLVEACDAYIRKYELDFETRFDIIFISFPERNPRINHVENAFYPTLF